MIQVRVNDANLNIPTQGLNTLSNLVEYVKSSIDPETIIVSLTKNNEPLLDSDWRNPISLQSDMVLSFVTGSKLLFVDERLVLGEEILESFISKIEACAQSFKQLRVHSANKEFGLFIEDLSAFVNWLNSIFLMDKNRFESEIASYKELVSDLEKVCGAVQNQQMTSSWWALGDALTNKMLPVVIAFKTLVTRARCKGQS